MSVDASITTLYHTPRQPLVFCNSETEFRIMMDENNVHTSLVIELAKQNEAENQKAYRIDTDDVDSPKDYVIDQIYCGENVTVYALLEVPEGSKVSDYNLIDISNKDLKENYKFFHKNSYKEGINKKKINTLKYNLSGIHSDEDTIFSSDRQGRNGSLYCLKHVGDDYSMLTPEKKNSELKVLYNKEAVSKYKTPKGFKFKSKGVNTDIVQSPKIVEEVQKAVGMNIPFVKNKGKNAEDFCSLSKSLFELIETDMRQSYSSVNFDSDKKSDPNFFIVPLLVVEDGILNNYLKKDKSQKLEEEKPLNSKGANFLKVPLGTDTDLSCNSYKKTNQDSNEISLAESYKADLENFEIQNPHEKNKNPMKKLKISSKEMIIKEIKVMQKKLNILIQSMESSENESNRKTIDERNENLERMSEPLLNEIGKRKYQTINERPIFLSYGYSSHFNKVGTKTKKRTPSITLKSNETCPKKSVANNFSSNNASSELIEVKNDETAKDIIKKLLRNSNLENRKAFGLSKSESCIRIITPTTKHNSSNGFRKSQSFDLKSDKIEALKNTKNFLYKVEGMIKTKTNLRSHQNNEGPLMMKCEMGDDVDKKPINTKSEVLNVIQIAEKRDKPEKSENSGIEAIVSDMKKNFCEKEEDAESVNAKEAQVPENTEKVQALHNHCANVITSESLLKPKKSNSPRTMMSKTSDKSAEVETKIISDTEKPITPNKSSRKINTTESSSKKDVKISKPNNSNVKINNKVKTTEKFNKVERKEIIQTEADKKRALTGSRKSARHNAESKLHINKLIKLDSMGNNQRTPFLMKSNHFEKPGAKSERVPRPNSQKQQPTEHTTDMLLDENNIKKVEMPNKKSVTLVQVDSLQRNNVKEAPMGPSNKEKMAEEDNLKIKSENLVSVSTVPSPVVFEIISKKPNFENELNCDVDQENLEKPFRRENATFEKNGAVKEANENSENFEKEVVKSVWAITKLLLYEDGTNKLEVLEASLTPPDHTLAFEK